MNDLELNALIVKNARIAATLDALNSAKDTALDDCAIATKRREGYYYNVSSYAMERKTYAAEDLIESKTRYVVIRKPKAFAEAVAIPCFTDPWKAYETLCAACAALERDKKETAERILAEMDAREITEWQAPLECKATVQERTNKKPREGATPIKTATVTISKRSVSTPILRVIKVSEED